MGTEILLLQSILNGLVIGTIYVLMAVGFSLVFGILRVVNFAHGEFYMLGGFAFAFTWGQWGLPFPLALILSAVLVALLGIVVERGIFRRFRGQELNSMIAALGLAIILQNVALLVFGPSPRAMPGPVSGVVELGPLVFPASRLFVLAAALVIFGGFWALMSMTKLGRAMRALAQDPEIALIQGIRIDRITPIAFALGIGLAGIAGCLMAPLFSVSPFVGLVPMLKAFIVVILGGLGSVAGAALAGMLLGVIESVTGTFFGAAVTDMLQLGLVILILLVRPWGLLGHKEQ